MILVAHVIIALASLATSAYSAVRPSRGLLYLSYGSVGLTLASGSLLVITNHSAMIQACVSGLVFSAASLGLATVARRKLAVQA